MVLHLDVRVLVQLQPSRQLVDPLVPFPGPVMPFLRLGWARLDALVSAWGAAGEPSLISDRARSDLLRGLAGSLRAACSPAAILELNVARLEGALIGATPRERFQDFTRRHLTSPDRVARFLGEYPVLARQMARRFETWLEAAAELLGRYVADRVAVARLAGSAERAPRIESLATGLSDSHRGGRAVCRLELSGGATIVYKPKSLAIDRRFQGMLAWLHRRGLRPSHRRLRIIDRGTHGWVEYVESAPCLARAQVERFYWRLGSQLALLYVLQAVDLHFENLVAEGEFPVPVDLESLFHSRLAPPATDARARAQELLGHSVCSIGLLPTLDRSRDGRAAIDLSGMGGRNGDTLPVQVPHDPGRIRGHDAGRAGRGADRRRPQPSPPRGRRGRCRRLRGRRGRRVPRHVPPAGRAPRGVRPHALGVPRRRGALHPAQHEALQRPARRRPPSRLRPRPLRARALRGPDPAGPSPAGVGASVGIGDRRPPARRHPVLHDPARLARRVGFRRAAARRLLRGGRPHRGPAHPRWPRGPGPGPPARADPAVPGRH